jgi:hypothetical protein
VPGLDVGSIYTTLGFRVDRSGVGEYKREVTQVRTDSRNDVVTKARLDVDKRGFQEFRSESDKANASAADLGRAFRGLFDQAGKIATLGVAAQGLSALGAGAVAATSALAPLTGALGALPAAASAGAQAMGVLKLASSGLGDAVKLGLDPNKIAEYMAALNQLEKPAQSFVTYVVSLKDNLTQLQRTAQGGFLPGAERGLRDAMKNFDVLRKGVADTSDVMGDLAEQFGSLVGSRGFGRDLETQMGRNATTIRRFGEGAINLADALRNVTLAAGPMVDWMTRGALRFTELIQRQTEVGRSSGALAGFFQQTQVQMSRIIRIAADLGGAFLNIGKAAYPLGNEILVAITKNADAFRRWTESARGQNAIAQYFRDARPAIFEAGRLLQDVTQAFFRLGRGDQVAPLIRQIRTELLPVLEGVVDNTTRAFGPAFFRAVTEALKLFGVFAGSTGPLVAFTEMLGTILSGINRIIERVPAIGTALAAVVAVGGIAKALQITAAVTGLTTVNRLLRGTAVAAGTAGAAGAAGQAGGLLGVFQKLPGPIRAVSVALAALAFPKVAKEIGNMNKEAKLILPAMDDLRRRTRAASDSGDPTKMRAFANQLRETGRFAKGAIPELDALARGLDRNARRAEEMARTVRDVNRTVSTQWRSMRVTTEGTLGDIARFTTATSRTIKERLSSGSAEGRRALAENFREAAQQVKRSMGLTEGEITRAMRTGVTSTRTGTTQIRNLLTQGLRAMGLNASQAASIVRGGSLGSASDQTVVRPGSGLEPRQRGGRIRRAAGGWIGGRGMVSDDIVPIGDNALAAFGEYDAHGGSSRRAIINRHQVPYVETALAMGGYPNLDALPSGGQLPIIERAMSIFGGLDRLFATVNRPHMFAAGGMVSGDTDFVPGLRAALERMAQAAGRSIYVQSGRRTMAEQAALYQRYLAGTGNLAAKPNANAPHVRGIAADITPGREVFGGMAGRFGLAFTVPSESWHVELSGARGSLGGIGTPPPPLRQIRAPQIRGNSAITAMAQRAMNAATAGANAKLREAHGMLAASAADLQTAPRAPAGAGGGGGGSYSKSQLAGLWIQAGGPARVANIAAAIAMAESRGVVGATNRNSNGSIDRGLWQINSVHGALSQFDPRANARAAVQLYNGRGGDFTDWVQYNNGAYRQFLQPGGFLRKFGSGGFPFGAVSRISESRRGHSTGRGFNSVSGPSNLNIDPGPLQAYGMASEYAAIQRLITAKQNQYAVQERIYNMTDENPLKDDGSLNPQAIFTRVTELNGLIQIAADIFELVKRAREVAARTLFTLRALVGRLSFSILKPGRPVAERQGIAEQIRTYSGDADTWQETLSQLDQVDVPGRLLDVAALMQERDIIAGTQPTPMEKYEEPPTDPFPSGDGGLGGGGGGGGSGEDDARQQAIQQAREQELQITADRAVAAQGALQANLNTARSNLMGFTGSGDISSGGGSAFAAAVGPMVPGNLGTYGNRGAVGGLMGGGGGSLVVVNYQTLVPANATQSAALGGAVASALDSKVQRSQNKVTLK